MDNRKPNRPKTIKPEKKKLDADSLRDQLVSIPERTLKALTNLRAVKKEFGLPATMSGVTAKERQTLNMAFDSAGGFNAIYESMTLHAAELGQYPITSFVGYGVLQQIAQNGMIRACIQTVADDVSRRWITLASECWQRTSGTQKSNPLPSKGERRNPAPPTRTPTQASLTKKPV